ncbi:hypothetical protein [Kitasatospora sp. NPDC088783]|uniref:hypothetical protein n=1 Tax=Kitasatospora sp. NPDC088783 TaxID=3364077 RepID=UPI00382DBBD3
MTTPAPSPRPAPSAQTPNTGWFQDAAPEQIAQLVSGLLRDEGVLALTARLARQAARALDPIGSAPQRNPAAYEVRWHLADVADAIEDARAAIETATEDLVRGLRAWAATGLAEITAAHGSTGPRPESGERLHLFWVDGAFDRAPYLGLVGPDHTDGDAQPYCTAGFTREVAEHITADLAADGGGLTARWDSRGELRFSWTAEHAGMAGSEDVAPDGRGLYRIGGLWPWFSFELPPAALQPHPLDADRTLSRVHAQATPTVERASGGAPRQGAGAVPDPAAAMRRLTALLDETADPAEAARLVEQAEQHLEALSDFLGAAARWSGAREGTAHLQLDLGRTSQDVYDAGADLADAAAGLRAAAPRPARIRSAAPAAAAPAAQPRVQPSARR